VPVQEPAGREKEISFVRGHLGFATLEPIAARHGRTPQMYVGRPACYARGHARPSNSQSAFERCVGSEKLDRQFRSKDRVNWSCR